MYALPTIQKKKKNTDAQTHLTSHFVGSLKWESISKWVQMLI